MAPFLIVVVDRSKGKFTVKGPMTDDSALTSQVVDAQKKGREVNCFTAGKGQLREQVIASYSKSSGYIYTDDPIV